MRVCGYPLGTNGLAARCGFRGVCVKSAARPTRRSRRSSARCRPGAAQATGRWPALSRGARRVRRWRDGLAGLDGRRRTALEEGTQRGGTAGEDPLGLAAAADRARDPGRGHVCVERVAETPAISGGSARRRCRAAAEEVRQVTTLNGYFQQMSDLMLNNKLKSSKEGDEVRALARTVTLTTLRRLDRARKGELVRFL